MCSFGAAIFFVGVFTYMTTNLEIELEGAKSRSGIFSFLISAENLSPAWVLLRFFTAWSPITKE